MGLSSFQRMRRNKRMDGHENDITVNAVDGKIMPGAAQTIVTDACVDAETGEPTELYANDTEFRFVASPEENEGRADVVVRQTVDTQDDGPLTEHPTKAVFNEPTQFAFNTAGEQNKTTDGKRVDVDNDPLTRGNDGERAATAPNLVPSSLASGTAGKTPEGSDETETDETEGAEDGTDGDEEEETEEQEEEQAPVAKPRRGRKGR